MPFSMSDRIELCILSRVATIFNPLFNFLKQVCIARRSPLRSVVEGAALVGVEFRAQSSVSRIAVGKLLLLRS